MTGLMVVVPQELPSCSICCFCSSGCSFFDFLDAEVFEGEEGMQVLGS